MVSNDFDGFCHSDEPLAYPGTPPKYSSASGVVLVDDDGREYIDAIAGTFNVSLGYGQQDVVEAIQRVLASGLCHVSSSVANDEVSQAAKKLVEIAPGDSNICHLSGSTGGSTAIEQAIRHSLAKTGGGAVLCFNGGYHGQTMTTAAVSGVELIRARLPDSRLPVIRIDPPDCYRCPVGRDRTTCDIECAGLVQDAIWSAGMKVSMMIAEPILGVGGGITAPEEYWVRVKATLEKHSVQLILDEVQTFGRAGSFFAASYYNITPEFIVTAKGITGIGIPGAGALLAKRSDAILRDGERSLTGGGSPIVCAAIAATITVMQQEQFFPRMMASAALLRERLAKIESEYDAVGAIRGIGLMTGFEIVKSKQSRERDNDLALKIKKCALENGLILRLSHFNAGGFVKIRPALTISVDEITELCDRLEFALSKVLR